MDFDLETLGLAFRVSPVGQALLDADGAFLIVNAAMCSLLHRTEEDLLGMTLNDITDPIDRGVQNVKLEEMGLSLIDSFQSRRRYPREDGQVAYAQVSLTALRDERGDVRWLLMQLADLSDENLLQETFRLLASYGSDVVLRTDDSGVVLWISPTVQSATKWRPEQLAGVPLIGLIHPEDRATALEVHEDPQGGRYRARFLAADGGFTTFDVQVDPLPGQHGQIVGRVATLRTCG